MKHTHPLSSHLALIWCQDTDFVVIMKENALMSCLQVHLRHSYSYNSLATTYIVHVAGYKCCSVNNPVLLAIEALTQELSMYIGFANCMCYHMQCMALWWVTLKPCVEHWPKYWSLCQTLLEQAYSFCLKRRLRHISWVFCSWPQLSH